MVNTTTNVPASVPKKKRSSGGLKKKKPSAYNKFMTEEMTRLRSVNVELTGAQRRTMACEAWKASKASSSSSGSSP